MAVIGVMFNLGNLLTKEALTQGQNLTLSRLCLQLRGAKSLRPRGWLIEGNDTAYLKLMAGNMDIVFNMCEDSGRVTGKPHTIC